MSSQNASQPVSGAQHQPQHSHFPSQVSGWEFESCKPHQRSYPQNNRGCSLLPAGRQPHSAFRSLENEFLVSLLISLPLIRPKLCADPLCQSSLSVFPGVQGDNVQALKHLSQQFRWPHSLTGSQQGVQMATLSFRSVHCLCFSVPPCFILFPTSPLLSLAWF